MDCTQISSCTSPSSTRPAPFALLQYNPLRQRLSHLPMERLIRTFLAMLTLAAAMLVALGYYAQSTTRHLSKLTSQTLRENYDSVQYMDRLLRALQTQQTQILLQLAYSADGHTTSPTISLDTFDHELTECVNSELNNITLPGEQIVAEQLAAATRTFVSQRRQILSPVPTSASVRPHDYDRQITAAQANVIAKAEAIRHMNQQSMENVARTQTDTAPKFIISGTLLTVVLLLLGGAHLTQRLSRQARELQALRTHFVAMASHELRTPVTSLKMGLDVLASGGAGELSDDQMALVEAGVEDCARLLALSRQLLDVTKIQSGQLEMRPAAIELRPLIAEAIKSLRHLIQERRITVDIDFRIPSDTNVEVDPTKTLWVMTNILGNALRYSPHEGRILIVAELRANALGLQRSREVYLSVSDMGPGISQSSARRVFQPFYQANSSESSSGQSGLGLAIAQEIVSAHGGRIWVEPEPALGQGTTITFTLPLTNHAS